MAHSISNIRLVIALQKIGPAASSAARVCAAASTFSGLKKPHRLRGGPHRRDELAGHTREIKKAARVHLGEWSDDLEHVAAGTAVSAGAGHHDRLDAFVACGRTKDIRKLGAAFGRQRIFSFRTVERDRRDSAGNRKARMLRTVA